MYSCVAAFENISIFIAAIHRVQAVMFQLVECVVLLKGTIFRGVLNLIVTVLVALMVGGGKGNYCFLMRYPKCNSKYFAT